MKKVYFTNSILCTLTPNDYENGENPNETMVFENNIYFEDNNIIDLIKKICCQYDLNIKNAVVFDDEILIEGLTDENEIPLTEKETELWKEGKCKAYSFIVRFSISEKREILHDELVDAGIVSYD